MAAIANKHRPQHEHTLNTISHASSVTVSPVFFYGLMAIVRRRQARNWSTKNPNSSPEKQLTVSISVAVPFALVCVRLLVVFEGVFDNDTPNFGVVDEVSFFETTTANKKNKRKFKHKKTKLFSFVFLTKVCN